MVYLVLGISVTPAFWVPTSFGYFSARLKSYYRILAVGESLITLVTMRSKQHLLNINCLHLRTSRGVRRVDNNFHFQAPGKNCSTNRSLRALISKASHFFCLSGCATGDLRVDLPETQLKCFIKACFTA